MRRIGEKNRYSAAQVDRMFERLPKLIAIQSLLKFIQRNEGIVPPVGGQRKGSVGVMSLVFANQRSMELWKAAIAGPLPKIIHPKPIDRAAFYRI